MSHQHALGTALISLSLTLFAACADPGGTGDFRTDSVATTTEDPADSSEAAADATSAGTTDTTANEETPITDSAGETQFTHKMMKSTGENPMASLGYECPQCTFAQWLSIEPPEGWSKGPAQVIASTSGELRSKPTFDDVPSTVDFLEEVPGNEYEIIVKNIGGRFIESSGNRLVIEVEVMRDTLLRFAAGKRVHELTDPDGHVFVLFAYGVDPENVVIPDFDDPYFMGLFLPPEGWSYTSRVLEDELVLDTPEFATVLAIRGEHTSTWEKREP